MSVVLHEVALRIAAKAERGFTLIELMIVVAIIGLLAALAVPNFLRFQARARQTEVRGNLRAATTEERAYYGNYQSYYDIFNVIGFGPEMNNRYAYFAQNVGDNAGELRVSGLITHTSSPSAICPSGPHGDSAISVDELKWTNNVDPKYKAPSVSGTQASANSLSGAAVAAIGAFPAGTCCPQGGCDYAIGAVGNIDDDLTLDEWFITSQSSVLGGATQACQIGASPSGTTGTFAEGEPVNVCNDVAL